jgi:hypothetical protein
MISGSVRRAAPVAAFGATLACANAIAFLADTAAHALDGQVTTDSAAQFYDVRSPTGETILERRRLTATLGLGVDNFFDTNSRDPHAPELSLRLRLRYDADYGAASSTSDPTAVNSVVPGFAPQTVDVMYFYLEGRRLFGGWFAFKVGRQYLTDVLGWWSFDGGDVSVTTPYYAKIEAYGGLEQRGGMPLSTSRFEGDGVWRGDRTAYDPLLYRAFQPAEVAPAFGVALESIGLPWIHGRVTYRRVYDTGPSNVTEFAGGDTPSSVYDHTRISSERFGAGVDASAAAIGSVKGGIVYDFYRTALTSANASIDAYVGPKITLSADYDYYLPAFDADSIWNFFAGEPRNDVGIRANVDVDRRLSIAGNLHARVFSVQTAPFEPGGTVSSLPSGATGDSFPRNGHPFDEGGNVSARWHTGETRIAAHASGDFGTEGDRVGGDLSAEHVFETRYVVGGRAGLWQWKDELRPDRAATSFQYVANAGYRFAPRCRGSVEWEHDMNGLVGQRFRVMFVLSLGMGGP